MRKITALLACIPLLLFWTVGWAQQPLTFQNGATATGNGLAYPVSSYNTCLVAVQISVTATVTFEGQLGSAPYVAILGTNVTDHTTSSAPTASGNWYVPCSGYDLIRVRISSYGSGTVTVTGKFIPLVAYVDGGGGGGGGANTALSNLAAVSVNLALIPQTGLDVGATATPWRNVFLYGSGTFSTTSVELTGTPTGNRVVTFPDSSTSIPISAQTLTFTGPSAPRTITLPDAAFTVARTDAANTFTGNQTITGFVQTTGAEGSQFEIKTAGLTDFKIAVGATGLYVNDATNSKTPFIVAPNTSNSLTVGTSTVAVVGPATFSSTLGAVGAMQSGTVSVATGGLALANSASAFLTTIQAGNAAAARTYTWPTNFGGAGTVLTDAAGNGTLSWAAASGGVTTTSPLSGTTALSLLVNVDFAWAHSQSFVTGLGAISQLQGPTDQPFALLAQSPVVAAISTAGNALNLTASPAIAGNVTAGAAAGGFLNFITGAAARLTSGNANGGDEIHTLGAGIGTGRYGQVVLNQAAFAGSGTWLSLQYANSEYVRFGNFGSYYGMTGGTANGNGTSGFGVAAGAHIYTTTTWEVDSSSAAFITGSNAANTVPTLTINSVGYTTKPGLEIDLTAAQTAIPFLVKDSSSNALFTVTASAGAISKIADAGTTTVVNAFTESHISSGTPAVGFGIGALYNLNSSTTADRNAGQLAFVWNNATDATRSADFVVSNVNNAAALAETFRITSLGQIIVPQTLTAGGSTGNQTINKAAGSVRIAASGTTVTVTDSFCTANSIVLGTIATNDTTSTLKNIVASAGSFVITLSAAATAETEIRFFVLNQ